MSRRKKIIVANWKMAPASLKEAVTLFNEIKKISRRTNYVDVVVCPPSIYLLEGRRQLKAVGGQNLSSETKPAHTGEISARMLAENGIKYVILGHSERRAMGETDEVVNKKVEVALSEGLKVILCVGESERDEHAEYLTFLKNQLKNSLKRINRKYIKNLIIAYEPLFTIGQKDFKAMDPHEIHQMVIFIRRSLLDHFSDRSAGKVPILYGGSVSTLNAGEIVKGGEVDGLLIGRQSLDKEDFGQIVRLVNKV